MVQLREVWGLTPSIGGLAGETLIVVMIFAGRRLVLTMAADANSTPKSG